MTLRVAVCTRSIAFGDGVGGMERAAADHITGLMRRGVDIQLFTPVRDGADYPDGLTVVDVPWPGWSPPRGPLFSLGYLWWARRARSSMRMHDFDVAHFHGAAVGVLSRTAEQTLGSPAVANPHGMEEFDNGSFLRRMGRLPTRHLSRRARHASRVVATDASLVEPAAANLAVDLSQIVVIPNAVDIVRLSALASARINPHFTVVTVGRIVANKGYDLLPESLVDPRVQSLLPERWSWVHYGDGPDLTRLLNSVHDCPGVDFTVLTERSDAEVQSGLAGSDLFVQPSRYEGSSLTTLEAMSHGCLVVGTAVGGIPDKIADGISGFLAATASVVDIAEAIVRALSCDEESVRMTARQVVHERFGMEAAMGSYVQLYEELVDAHATPGSPQDSS